MENKKIICTVGDLKNKGMSELALQPLYRTEISCEVGNNNNTYQIYLNENQVFEGDLTETENLLERMEEAILYPEQCVGEGIKYIREQNGLTQSQLKDILLINEEEIRLLESNKIVPSGETVTFLGNMFSIYPSSIINGEPIQMRNKDELQKAINDLALDSEKIKQSTMFYKEYLKDKGIKQEGMKEEFFIGKDAETNEKYVVLDTQDETCILSEKGEPQIFSSKEEADRMAETLNQKNNFNKPERSSSKRDGWISVKDEEKEIRVLADQNDFTPEEGKRLLEQHKQIERELKAPRL